MQDAWTRVFVYPLPCQRNFGTQYRFGDRRIFRPVFCIVLLASHQASRTFRSLDL